MQKSKKMGELKVPLTKKGFYTENQISQNNALLDSLKAKIGQYIIKSCRLVNLEPALLATLIFVENPSNKPTHSLNDKTSSYSYCQISIQTVSDSLFNEFRKGRMTIEEEDYLASLIGRTKVDAIKKAKTAKAVLDADIITSTMMLDVETNIFFGAVYFKQCVDKEHIAGSLPRLDKAVVYYNTTIYRTIPPSVSTDQLLTYSSIPQITKDYILKMFGSTSPLLYAMKIYA